MKAAALAAVVGLSLVATGCSVGQSDSASSPASGPASGSPAVESTATTQEPAQYHRPPIARLVAARQLGVSLLAYGNGAWELPNAKTIFARLAADHANAVSIAIPDYVDGVEGNQVYADPAETPSPELLQSLVAEAHASGLRVFLRLLVDQSNLGPHWRGQLAPTDPSAWFASYRDLLVTYAKAAEASGVDYLSIGDELNSLEGDPAWASVISAVRDVYHGALTYCGNWNGSAPAFASSLDLVGVDAYYPLSAPDNPTVSQLVAGWQPGVRQLEALHEATGKPLMICELGLTPWANAFRTPWAVQPPPGTAWDPAQQALYYQATISATSGSVAGWYWWDTEIGNPTARPPISSPQYDLLGLPAEEVLSQNYERLQG